MSPSQELELHFAAWRTYYGAHADAFVSDGIIGGDDKYWLNAPLRIVFLLREAHDRQGLMQACGYDLRTLWRNVSLFPQARSVMPTRTVRWAGDIYEACGFLRPDPNLLLNSIALLNLKKISGTATAKPREIQEFAQRDRWFLATQMNILKPQVVVCGGTLDVWDQCVEQLTPVDSERLCFRRDQCIFLNHVHPAARGGLPAKRHAAVMAAFQRLKDFV